jgi:hypothetical protein
LQLRLIGTAGLHRGCTYQAARSATGHALPAPPLIITLGVAPCLPLLARRCSTSCR